MDFSSGHFSKKHEIIKLFTTTFSTSDGAAEGKLVGDLVNNLISETPSEDWFVFTVSDENGLIGCILFSRLSYDQDNRIVFILSPVAVKTERQKEGVGQKLITYGLDELRLKGIDDILTYGDPRFYSKLGFRQITEKFAQAPLNLNYPDGWMWQSLREGDQKPLIGPSRCVKALNNPALW